MITIQDFKNVELVVARILEVREHANADRLYVLKVDTGSDQRQVVAGIRAVYTPEQLVGRQVVFVRNLQPAVIRGEESQGMVLAASDERGPVLLTLDREAPLGTVIK
jgi:methionine--tRNA ligase beta chain